MNHLILAFLLFTNIGQYTTNLPQANSNYRDTILLNTNFCMVSSNVNDAFGNSYALRVSSSPEVVENFSSEGWANQIYNPVTGQSNMFAFQPPSFGNNLVTNIAALTNGISPSGTTNRYSSFNGTTTNGVTLNPNFWLKNIGGVESVSLLNNGTEAIGVFLITSNIVITTQDSSATNVQYYFVRNDGTIAGTKGIAFVQIPGAYSATVMMLVDPPVTGITYMSLLDTNFAAHMSFIGAFNGTLPLIKRVVNYPIIFCTFQKSFVVQDWNQYAVNSATSGIQIYSGTSFWYPNWYSPIISGDSGHPFCTIVGTNLAAVGECHTTAGGDMLISSNMFPLVISNACWLETNFGRPYCPVNVLSIGSYPNY